MTSVGTGYVDDVTLGLSIPQELEQNERTVHAYIKRMSQLWEQLLFITGGQLELSKCFWVPITWHWTQGKPRLVTKHNHRKELYLHKSETEDLVQIPRKLGTDVEKRLGIYSSCDRKWGQEYKQWKHFSRNFGIRLSKSQVGRMAGYLAYHSIWLANFRYSAPVLGFTISQLDQIQRIIISPCLSQGGYCNKILRAVVYGPAVYGGMDWENIKMVVLYECTGF